MGSHSLLQRDRCVDDDALKDDSVDITFDYDDDGSSSSPPWNDDE